jgi:ribosomal protein S18 acetylase RimI-like enzyme
MLLNHNKPVKPALHPWGFKVRAINIRKELNLWASIQNKLFREISGYVSVTAEFLNSLSLHDGYDPNLIVVAEAKDIIVGLCVGWSFTLGNGNDEGKILQIKGIGVHPDFQRKGLGSALLQEVMNRAYLKRHMRTEVFVAETNQAATNLFAKHGFRKRYKRLWYTGPCR